MQATTTSQKIRIGLFTILGILLLFAGIFFIGKSKSLFTSTYHVYGTFNNVGGLQIGNNVRFAGITAGSVDNITVLNDSTVRVDMRVQSKYQKFIKTDAVASIGSDGLMGDKLVTIAPGTVSQTPLKDGQRIVSVNPTDFDKVITKFTAVADHANTITAALADMATEMRGGKGTIGRLMYNDDLAVQIEGTMANANRMSAAFADLGNQVRSGKGSVGQLLYTDQLSQNLNNVSLSANKAMVSADDAVKNINQAAYNFSENMKALQGNFLFRSYFRKKEAAEGAEADILEQGATIQTTPNQNDLTDAELQEIRRSAEKSLENNRKTQKSGK
ncbi:MAG: MCE family protein [Sphingobacteriales bacterium]|nr:MAG: MCE family protein [Sphingobacteriales bacterium]